MLIGFSGKMAVGKNTCADYLTDRYGGAQVAFADELKRVSRELFAVDPARKDDRTRGILQRVGVAMREIEEDVWVNAALRKAYQLEGTLSGPICFTDVRFPNEADAIHRAGGKLVKVVCEERVRLERIQALYPETTAERLNHISETALDSYTGWDFLLWTGGYGWREDTVQSMHKQLDAIYWVLSNADDASEDFIPDPID